MNNSPFLGCIETRFVILLTQQQLYLHESTTNLSFSEVGRDMQFEGKDSGISHPTRYARGWDYGVLLSLSETGREWQSSFVV